MNFSEIYLKAAGVIRANGHYKGAYYGVGESGVGIILTAAESPVCTAGALSIAISGQPVPTSDDFDEVAEDFARRTHLAFDPAWPTIAIGDWNDAPERTPADVIAALEQAAREVA
ncbi:hypothetical protein [Streptomyces sp. NPDC005799]|uniref:DUF6197 family protein n=1 Tax=Streptomyces sp. NPDC005799 TaxID=3154678 RepID=UPI0033C8CFE3